MKDRNLFHTVNTIFNIFTRSCATHENITRWCPLDEINFDLSPKKKTKYPLSILGTDTSLADSLPFLIETLYRPWFVRVSNGSLLKTLQEKEKLLVTRNFSFSHSVFYLFGNFSAIFIIFKKCRLQTISVWRSLKFVVLERVKETR